MNALRTKTTDLSFDYPASRASWVWVISLCILIGSFHASDVDAAPTGDRGNAWRLNNPHVEKRTESEARIEFAERVAELTENRLVLNIYHGGSLGVRSADLLRALRIGAIEMSILFPDYFGRDSREVASILPFGVVSTQDELLALLPALKEIYSEIYAAWNIEVVGWQLSIPFSTTIFCNEPVSSIEELQDKKVRVWHKGLINTFSRLGVAAQIIPSNDLYIAMQTGVVDCALFGIAQADARSLQEVSDYAVNISILTGLTAIGVNEDTWAELPSDLQTLVRQAGEELLQYSIEKGVILADTLETRKIAEFSQSGELNFLGSFSPEDTAAFRDAAIENWGEEAAAASGKAIEYRDRLVDIINQHHGQRGE